MQIDIAYDFRADSSGRDPDKYSRTLRLYHRLLWGKPLPNGRLFELSAIRPRAYLYHQSELGEFFLSSDSVIPSFTRWQSMQPIISQIPEQENEAFRAIGYTIGGMMIFPGNKVDGKPTINGARGFTRKIADRLDLTLECIRRHYLGQASPLGDTLARYESYFALFENFGGYVRHFMLEDLVNEDCSTVKYFMPFDDFKSRSTPKDIESYKEYRRLSIAFIEARNRRIKESAAQAALHV